MPKPAHDTHDISDAEEARIQAGIAADADNPEWTDADFAQARPAADVMPAELFAALARRGGRPKAEVTKTPVKLRLDPHVIELFKADGAGWQTRMNRFLAAHTVVLQMIKEHEMAARDMRKVFRQMERGDLKPVAPSLTKSLDRARRSLDVTEATVVSLRNLLADQAAKQTGAAGTGV